MVRNWLPQDFRDFFKFLNEEKVEYLLIGGWAVGVHGCPRYTADLDVWIARTPENAAKVVEALERFGFSHGEVNRDLVLKDGNIIRMGFPPMRIEISNRISGVEFDDCVPRRVVADMDGIEVPVIGLQDLLKNKKASGRPKHVIDIDNLTA
jgi:hypothetical protein